MLFHVFPVAVLCMLSTDFVDSLWMSCGAIVDELSKLLMNRLFVVIALSQPCLTCASPMGIR